MLMLSRTIPTVLLITLTASWAAAAEPATLKHDDNMQDSKRSITGAGQAVRFECPTDEKWYVTAISIHGSRYGTPAPPNEDFQIVVASDDLSQRQMFDKPYRLFQRGDEKWVKIGFTPVEVQGAFQIATFFNPTRTKGVYVGIDSDSTPTHSAILLASDPGKKSSELAGDWMIRAHLTQEIGGEALALASKEELSQQQMENEAEREKKILGDARSLTLKHDEGSPDEVFNIEGALYTVEFETPKKVQGYVWEVQMYGSEFGGQHDSEAVSGDVFVLNEDREIITRTTFPYSLATQQKQWISIPTLPTKVKGKFYISINTHGNKYKGIYLGYLDGNQQGVASTDEQVGNKIQKADWSEKFKDKQWMIRVKIADRPVVY